MNTQHAQRLLARKITLPTPPAVMRKLSSLLEDPDAGARDVGCLVAEDVGLSAKVLEIANSSYYGLRERCLAPQQAASVLGMKVLRNVVMQAAVLKQYEHLQSGAFDIDNLWRHSILSAQCCQFLGRKCSETIGLAPDELYICGLLHDLGQVVLLEALGREYIEVVEHARSNGIEVHAAEEELLGFAHPDVGALLAAQWGLPDSVRRAIQFHHAPEQADADPLARLVRYVNCFTHSPGEGDAEQEQGLGLESEALAQLQAFARQAQAGIVL